VGSLSGNLVDDETGLGVSGVLISAGGQVAATDESGRFTFPGLRPGLHQITVDLSSLPTGTIVAGAGSHQIVVAGGEEREVELRTVRSVSFGGSVILAESDSVAGTDSVQSALRDMATQPGVVVEATSGDLVVRRLSDRWGKFEFRDMRAGVWVLRVSSGEVPSGRRPEKEAYHLSLRPGERQSIDIRLVPKKKIIQILDGGELR
jgi:hypothetical protein